jgi:hypothetical protein
MNVKDAIRYLSELPEDEEIVIAWWRWQDSFSEICTEEEWNEAMGSIEKWMDWSSDHEFIEYLIEESRKTR